MENPSSPLETLRQLKEMLDAGALTPTEFEALKQRLLFSAAPADTVAPAAPAHSEPAAPTPAPPVLDPPAPRAAVADLQPEPASSISVAASPAQSIPEPESVAGWAASELPEAAEPAARSPLALILSIGGLLGLLALVLYLSLNRPASEHISSTSQTAADSLATHIETGPQVVQLPPPVVAMPETVRVAPAHPAPIVPARRPEIRRDSAVGVPAPAVLDSAVRR